MKISRFLALKMGGLPPGYGGEDRHCRRSDGSIGRRVRGDGFRQARSIAATGYRARSTTVELTSIKSRKSRQCHSERAGTDAASW